MKVGDGGGTSFLQTDRAIQTYGIICTSNEIEIDYTEQNFHWTTYYIRPLSFKAMSSLCYKNVLVT